jgi:hypothetical protein
MKPNLVLFTSRQNDPTGCILVRKYQKIQSTDQSTILTNVNIYLLNLKLKFKIKKTLQLNLKKSIFDHCSILLYNQEQSIPHGQAQISVIVRGASFCSTEDTRLLPEPGRRTTVPVCSHFRIMAWIVPFDNSKFVEICPYNIPVW